jgi:hypothetical protein
MRKGEKIDWGTGIPKYQKEDLMTKDEIHDFGIEVVCGILKTEGHNLEIVNNTFGYFPSIISVKENKVHAIVVLTDIAPKIPEISYENKRRLIEMCEEKEFIPCFASVGIGSNDSLRFENQIALNGDGYYVRFLGLEFISNDTPKLGTKEYAAWCLYNLGMAYTNKDISYIENNIDDNCTWYSEFSNYKYNDKNEILEYYNAKLDTIRKSNTVIFFEIVEFDGDFSEIVVDNLYIKGDSVGKSNVRIPQKNGELALLIHQELEGQTNGLIISANFNDDGKIVDISLHDPYKFNFKKYY